MADDAVRVISSPSALTDAALLTPYEPGGGFPLFVQPRDRTLRDDPQAAIAWFHDHRAVFDELLLQAGVLVFRGFPIENTAAFGEMISQYETPHFGYTAGSSPRKQLAPKVFESTYLAADETIWLHQEMSYLPTYPARIAFFCRTAPVMHGETTVGDVRRITAALHPGFVAALEERGVCYKRNLRDISVLSGNASLDLRHRPWQTSFNTDDRDKAFAQCKAMGMEPEWLPDGSLSTSYRSPGMITHPKTGERLWFNQVAGNTYCNESVGVELFSAFQRIYGKDRPLPYETTYGDGSPIPAEHLASLYKVLRESAIRFSWSHGDVMLLDNFLGAHGRSPYGGLRDIQVALLN
jgi:alpha-ketoglutarate-dependent taurine dioxygenase